MANTITTRTDWAVQCVAADGTVEQTIFYVTRYHAELAARTLNRLAGDGDPKAQVVCVETPIVEDDSPSLRLVTP